MIKNLEINFTEDNNEYFSKYIAAKNFHKSEKIDLLYEFLDDLLSENGKDLITWIGKTNFRKFIFEVYREKDSYSKSLNNYIESNKVSNEESLTLNELKVVVEEKIDELYKNFTVLHKKINNNTLPHPNLHDFFNDDISFAKTLEIQSQFKSETGKQMAILIHLLEENKLLNIDNNDRKRKSRLWFVRVFTCQFELEQINSISNYLDIDNKLKRIGKQDKQFKRINSALNNIINA